MNDLFTKVVLRAARENRGWIQVSFHRGYYRWEHFISVDANRVAVIILTSRSPNYSRLELRINNHLIDGVTVGPRNLEEGVHAATRFFACQSSDLGELALVHIDVPQMEALL